MNDIFRPLLGKCVVIYIDYILVFSKTHEEHAEHLRQVMQILQNQEIWVKLSKYEFAKSEVKFLGHVVGADGIKVDTSKTAVVSNWPVPNSLSSQIFLGLSNLFQKIYCKFLYNGCSAHPPTKKDAWCANCQKAFEKVKHALTHAPILALPDFSKPFEVSCDASIQGLGAVFYKKADPQLMKVISLLFRLRYTTGEQELLLGCTLSKCGVATWKAPFLLSSLITIHWFIKTRNLICQDGSAAGWNICKGSTFKV